MRVRAVKIFFFSFLKAATAEWKRHQFLNFPNRISSLLISGFFSGIAHCSAGTKEDFF